MNRHPRPLTADPSGTDDWLTTPEVASLLRVHPKHVYRLLHQGMPARRVGGQWRFSRDAIQTWADQRGEISSTVDASVPAADTSSSAWVACDRSEMSQAFVSAIADLPTIRFAVVPADAKRAVALLESGDVVAAIMPKRCAHDIACATVRVSLGERPVGYVARSDSPPARIAVTDPLEGAVAEWVSACTARGAKVHVVDSELEACCSVVRLQCDAAAGSRSWAERLGLTFHALGAEPWELVVRVDAMEDPHVSGMCVLAQGEAMRVRLAPMISPGVDKVGQMRLERGARGPAQHIAINDVEAADDRAARSRKAVRWTMLTRERAEQMLDLVQALRARGVRVGGFVQVPSGPASHKPLGYDLYRLSQPERLPIAERVTADKRGATGQHNCELVFHTSALVRAWEWLREDVAASDLLIVDGVGRLEEGGHGLFPALAWARTQARTRMIVLSSRGDHVPQIVQRLSLSSDLVTALSMGSETTAPADVVDRILQSCGKTRRRRRQPSLVE